jgi:hypothetical protein
MIPHLPRKDKFFSQWHKPYSPPATHPQHADILFLLTNSFSYDIIYYTRGKGCCTSEPGSRTDAPHAGRTCKQDIYGITNAQAVQVQSLRALFSGGDKRKQLWETSLQAFSPDKFARS